MQGGPGFPSPRLRYGAHGWLDKLLTLGFTILLLDQRGTGYLLPCLFVFFMIKLKRLQ